jgi:hypothetical protein
VGASTIDLGRKLNITLDCVGNNVIQGFWARVTIQMNEKVFHL